MSGFIGEPSIAEGKATDPWGDQGAKAEDVAERVHGLPLEQ